jgi:hypothetical protein
MPLASPPDCGILHGITFVKQGLFMNLIIRLAMVAGLCLSLPALAAPVLAQDAPAPAPAKPAKPKRICRVDPTLGSVVPRYVCHSKEEWAALDKATQDAAEGAQNGMGTMNTGTRNMAPGS